MFKHFKKLLFITPIITTISLPMVSLACTPQQQYIDAVEDWEKLTKQYEEKVANGQKEFTYLAIVMKNAASFYGQGNELANQAGGHFSANQYFNLVAQIEAKKKYVEYLAQALEKDPKMYNSETLDIISLYQLIYTNNSNDLSLGSIDALGEKIFNIWGIKSEDSLAFAEDIVESSKKYKLDLSVLNEIWTTISNYSYAQTHREIVENAQTFKELSLLPLQADENKWNKIELASSLIEGANKAYKLSLENLSNLFKSAEFINSLTEEQKAVIKQYQSKITEMKNNAMLANLQSTLANTISHVFKDIYLKILFSFYQTNKFSAILSAPTYNKLITALEKGYKEYLELSLVLNSNSIPVDTVEKIAKFNVISPEEYSEINDKIKEYLTNNISKN
ncbi:hypothetical protein [Mycoplasma sp. 005V]|uniref:hypothetical protein n=1 Tax=unclassified Mycoplasma TaxID=2683645 RepID=UPI003A856E31